MTEKPPERILIVLLGAIGDVVRGLSLVGRLRAKWPHARICWAVEPASQELVENYSGIDRAIVFQRGQGARAFRSFLDEIRSGEFDLVLDLQRHLKSGLTSRASRAKRRIGFHRRNAKEGNWLFNTETIPEQENFAPKIDQYHAFGDYLGLPRPERYQFDIAVSDSHRAKLQETLLRAAQETDTELPESEKRVGLIIGANWSSKRWSARQFGELVTALYERWGLVSYLVAGKAELDIANEILNRCEHVPVCSLVGQVSLVELFEFFKAVKLVVGGDTGPMHLAAAAGAPVIALFGATSARRASPYGSETLFLQSPIGCSPCYRRTCPGLSTLCMLDIPTEAVMHRVDSIMANRWKQV